MSLLAGMAVLFGWVDWLALARWARPYAVPLALFAATVGGIAVAAGRLRGERAPRARVSGMSWWVVVAAAAVVVAVGWVATSLLLGEAGKATSADAKAATKVDAIKTGLGIAAGSTGIFALLLAVRRQSHSESDATEKNLTELYTKAADQLGSAEAPVRLAGLYALERLAHNNPGQRQSIVNVICAYLRMPYIPPDAGQATDSAKHQEQIQQREVRLAGQRILTDHVAPRDHRKFWGDLDLDLTNAYLIDFDLRECRVRTAIFLGATFTGFAVFTGATFTGAATFGGATFTNTAGFNEATFAGDTWFSGADFTGGGGFFGATFNCTTRFDDATFTGHADFAVASFGANTWFNGATFTGRARFGHATFSGAARFENAIFTGHTRFDKASFAATASFAGATFTGDAGFNRATFTGAAGSMDTTFKDTTFLGHAGFVNVIFTDDVRFVGATFTGDAVFDSKTLIAARDMTFTGSVEVVRTAFEGHARSARP